MPSLPTWLSIQWWRVEPSFLGWKRSFSEDGKESPPSIKWWKQVQLKLWQAEKIKNHRIYKCILTKRQLIMPNNMDIWWLYRCIFFSAIQLEWTDLLCVKPRKFAVHLVNCNSIKNRKFLTLTHFTNIY